MLINPHLPEFQQTALITGGAKRIGRKIALKLAARKFAIAIHYHQSHAEAQKLKAEIIESGGKADIFRADLLQRDEITALIPRIGNSLPPITTLINNASIFEWDEWHSANFASWDKHMMTNLEAPFWLSQAMATSLPIDYYGVIVNMVDQRVLKLTPYFTSYTIAKSALWSMTRTMALALAPQIRVNAIGPGPTLPSEHQSDEQFQKQYKRTPLGKAVPPDEIADAILFMLGQTSMTGQIIALDSGEHLGWTQENR